MMDWTNHLYLAKECSQGGRGSHWLPTLCLVLAGLLQLSCGLWGEGRKRVEVGKT